MLGMEVKSTLGKCALASASLLHHLGWVCFIKTMQFPTELASNIRHLPHPAVQFLHRLHSTGIPAPSSAQPWPAALKRQIFKRGPHVSAARLFRQFLVQDMLDYVHKKIWVVLP